MRFTSRRWGAVVAVGLAVVSAQSRPAPEVVVADVQLTSDLSRNASGELRLRLVIAADGTVTPSTEAGSALAGFALKMIRDWRFTKGPGEVDFHLVNTIVPTNPCAPSGPTPDTLIVARLPTFLEIQAPPTNVLCHEPYGRGVVSESLPLGPSFVARVVCDCPGLAGGSNTQVRVTPIPFGTGAPRTLSTDDEGLVRADGLPAGRYAVEVSKESFGAASFEVVLDPRVPQRVIELRVEPAAWANLPPSPFATAVRLPTYPPGAVEKNVEGDATVRVSLADRIITDVNTVASSPLLELGARETARAWRFYGSGTTVYTIDVRYRLLPGDCQADQRTQVTVRLRPLGSAAVDVLARRIVPCESGSW
jgi:hypothetical protein